MAIKLSDNIEILGNLPVDSRWGPYQGATIAAAKDAANAAILPYKRFVGLEVGIVSGNTIVTYWYGSGITNDDLVVKPGGSGSDGATGATGAAGAQGATGPAGSTGPAGIDGATGLVGPSGATGPQGVQGPEGAQGIQGIQGDVGPSGASGATGSTGPSGLQGIQGVDGSTGPSGATGPQGPQGAQGIQGIQGEQGLTGETGPSGASGATGGTGPSGLQGIQGIQGEIGSTGLTGSTGPSGATGPSGTQGLTGLTGEQGATGEVGPQGLTGDTGPSGASGATGSTGVMGATGPSGATGSQGPSGVSDRYQTTSNSTVNVDTGSRTLITVDKDLNYTANQSITVSSSANPSIYMTGKVTSYNKTSGELVFDVTTHFGSGDVTGWVVNLAGAVGAIGASGAQGATGPSGATGPQGATGDAATSLYNTGATGTVENVAVGGASGGTTAAEWSTKTIVQVLDEILFPTIPPTYSPSTLSLSATTGNREIGDTLTQNITLSFNQNDAGVPTELKITDPTSANTTVNSAGIGDAGWQLSGDIYSWTKSFSRTVASGANNKYYGFASHEAGTAKTDNKGNLDTRTPLDATTGAPQAAKTNKISSPASAGVTGILPYFYGTVVSAASTDASSIASLIAAANLGTSTRNKIVATSSGTVSVTYNVTEPNNRYLWLALPHTASQKTKWYVDSTNKALIGSSTWVVSGVSVSVTSPDGYWTNQSYDIYVTTISTTTGIEAIQFGDNSLF